MRQVKTNSEQETFLFAKEFASKLKPGDVICLSGDLGVGKTIFTKGVCEFFGVEDVVNSPTFTIVNEYESSSGTVLYHFDMYRLEEPEELIEIGFDDYLNSGAVCLIEWPENIANCLPPHCYRVSLLRCTEEGDDARIITIEEP